VAIINFYTRQPDSKEFDLDVIEHDGTALSWLLANIEQGENFKVYEGDINRENEITEDARRIHESTEISVFIAPSADPLTIAVFVVAVLAVVLLAPKIAPPSNVNRNQQSPNNKLSNRNNVPRPNQRIVDVAGKIKSIPDVIQLEFARYENNVEVRIGFYGVARNQLLIEDVKDGDSLISDIEGAAAGVYEPFKSPNNASPDIQIGDPINEPVVGVYQSSDAIGQTLKAPNSEELELFANTAEIITVANSAGYLEEATGSTDFAASFEAGDEVDLINIYSTKSQGLFRIGDLTHTVIAVTKERITFDITGDPSWGDILGGEQDMTVLGQARAFIIKITEENILGKFKVSSIKIDKLLVNVYAQNGMYKEGAGGRQQASVDYDVFYQKLADDGQTPVGPETSVRQTITGRNADEKGITTEIDLVSPTFVQFWLARVTPLDFEFEGNIVDEIKLKDVFGLFDIDKTEFGNITTIQTKRSAVSRATAIRNPELNCIATELVNKYEGAGVFNPALTPNTQAMQSLIRMALDPNIGRREQAEIDLDMLLATQAEIELYFQIGEAGQFSYSFDSTQISAQETFFLIGQAAFTTLWREGRVLKSLFEKPQTVPSMVFTHRSKQPGAETWNRKVSGTDKKDSIEFIYTDDKLHTQETLYFPANRSGVNPLRVEMPGVKGLSQATWHMMRRYNKLLYQEIDVDFGATQEGRFVKPKRLISVVKGSRVLTSDGYTLDVTGLLVTLSQEVSFAPGDDHFLVLKQRDGATESVLVTETENKRVVQLGQLPSEAIYTGNDSLKTEFSFGSESRLSGQLMLPEEISPTDKSYVKIKAINYTDLYYADDPVQPELTAFSSGFDSGFS
jgi:hypothetical protein